MLSWNYIITSCPTSARGIIYLVIIHQSGFQVNIYQISLTLTEVNTSNCFSIYQTSG